METKASQEFTLEVDKEHDRQQDQVKTPNSSPKVGRKMKRVSKENNDAMILRTESNEDHQILEEKDIHFFPPAEGTPAAQALQANADIKVSRLEKGIRRIKGIKHPKAKNITKFMKTKKKNKAFSRNFKGKVIDGVHELYTITAGMMLGLRLAVGRSNTASVQNLLLGDFSYVEKISFPPNGNNQPPFRTPPHQLAHTFKFKTYAPLVFSKLRDFFGVDSVSYMLSVCGNYNYLEFISNSKSGQFFFYSHDGRYMIKTQTNEENKFMKRILPHYYRYVTEHPHTFLVRILGMHRVKMYHLNRKTHFVIMESVFDTPEPIQKVYDLKGSLVGRKASQKDRDNGGVLKDNDLIDDGVKLELGAKRQAIIDQLEEDANFLAEMNIMDYSVLLGIHDRKTRHSGETEPSQLPSRNSVGSMKKSRSILPFRLKESQDSSLSSNIGDELNGTTPIKKRAHTLETHTKKHPHGQAKRLSCPVNLTDIPPNGLVMDDDNKTHSDADSCLEYDDGDEEDEYDDEEDDSHFDAGDSDLDFDTTTETSADLQARFRDVATALEDDTCDREGDQHNQQKKSGGLTGVNLTAVGKKSGVGKSSSTGGGDRDAASSIQSSSMYATVGGSTTAGSHTDHTDPSAYNSDSNSDDHSVDEEEEAGIGLAGEEGKAISKLFKDNVDLSAIASAGSRISMRGGISPSNSSQEAPPIMMKSTFGPGATHDHPWTGRLDGGVNSRLANGKRGNFIYYIGVIDILQQYNASKRIETVFKGLTNDKTQISSVDSVSYAKRFVKFMKDNTV